MDPGGLRGLKEALLAGLVAIAPLLACRDSFPGPPNVLLYTVDTLRADSLGCYGNRVVQTPYVDGFAAEGLLFENAFANSSWTRASMASLLTGLYPRRHGVQGRDDALTAPLETLADLLGRRGYATAFITANPNAGSVFGFGRGFGQIIELYSRRTPGYVSSDELVAASDRVTQEAIRWLEKAPRPFFLAVLSVDPHGPYTPPARFDRYGEDYAGAVDGSLGSLLRKDLSDADRRRIRSLYHAEVSYNDESFGRLLDYLRSTNLLDDTLAVFTADHGEEFWEYGRRGHGRSLIDESLRVPLVMRLPRSSSVERGTRAERHVQLVDLFPTVLDVVGIPPPRDLDGRSLLAARPVADLIYASLHLDGHRLEAVRSGPWKLVWNLDADRFDLFDLSRDSPEASPVQLSPQGEAPAVLQRLRAELERHAAAGPVAPPGVAPEELPPDVKGALRGLGYVD